MRRFRVQPWTMDTKLATTDLPAGLSDMPLCFVPVYNWCVAPDGGAIGSVLCIQSANQSILPLTLHR